MIKNIFVLLFITNVFAAHAQSVAIVGGGAAGVISAWLLEEDYDVTLYESDNRLGGHAHSINVNVSGESAVIEAGAEFFNKTSYPNFLKLLNHLKIPLKEFTMVTNFYHVNEDDGIILPPHHDGVFEWKSFRPANIARMLKLKSVVDRGHHLIASKNVKPSLRQFVEDSGIQAKFAATLLYPFLASNWGVKSADIQDFSAYNSLKYMIEGNEGSGYSWYEATNGLSEYINAIVYRLHNTNIRLNSEVKKISLERGRYKIVSTDGSGHVFDKVVFATNANIAGRLLSQLKGRKSLAQALLRVKYFDATVAVHGDPRFMPKDKKEWRVINIRYDGAVSAMTMYKKWKSKKPIFKSWLTYDVRSQEDKGGELPQPLYATFKYRHAAPDKTYFNVQHIVAKEQGYENIWFAGVWTNDNDSHESAVTSAINIARSLAPGSQRLSFIYR